MKYKINHWRCFWCSYKDTKLSFFDWLDNEWIGKILAYFSYYLASVVLFPIFLLLTFMWYVKRILEIKEGTLGLSTINTYKSRKIITELTHQHEGKG
jgi:hypothetical protein